MTHRGPFQLLPFCDSVIPQHLPVRPSPPPRLALGCVATPEARQDVCSWSSFKRIFGISQILDCASVIFIYSCMSRGLSEIAILLFIFITLAIDFFWIIWGSQQSTFLIFFAELDLACCSSPIAVYLAAFGRLMYWGFYMLWKLRSKFSKVTDHVGLLAKKIRKLLRNNHGLGGGLQKSCKRRSFYIGLFSTICCDFWKSLGFQPQGKIIIFHRHNDFIIILLQCLYFKSDFWALIQCYLCGPLKILGSKSSVLRLSSVKQARHPCFSDTQVSRLLLVPLLMNAWPRAARPSSRQPGTHPREPRGLLTSPCGCWQGCSHSCDAPGEHGKVRDKWRDLPEAVEGSES